ncbi:MAG: hypothetical protein KBF53_12105 [Sphingobium sp.]|nr:hypothetical protein [Sphingobium sp.]
MELLLSRSQKNGLGGLGSVSFVLDVRARFTPEEQAAITKYKLGKEVLYAKEGLADKLAQSGLLKNLFATLTARSRGLILTSNDFVKGRSIVCKDIVEMLDAEAQVRKAADGFYAILVACREFGSEEVITYPRAA